MGTAGDKPGCAEGYAWHCCLSHWIRPCRGILEPLEAELPGNLFDKAHVGVTWSDETSQSDVEHLPELKLGMIPSTRREKKGDPGGAMDL